MAYMSSAGIEAGLQYLAATYPAICQLIGLPEPSVEGRTCRAVKIAKDGGHRHGVLFVGGVHARELVNPDLLLTWAFNLCQAYSTNSALTFGPKSYSAGMVKLLVEALDIFVFPLVNPDGRVHVQSPAGYAWWRKNRSLNPGQPCRGVDINRNYDFLWSSGIGTSASACSEVFKGPGGFSEPETRNVRSLLQSYPHIDCMVDVHSYSELVLYPWGDDENQSTDPAMNFENPAYDGLRGTVGDSLYREYMPAEDADWFHSTGERIRDAIAAVRGRTYTVQQSINLYPTTGTAHDYAYSRHIVDAGTHRVYAYTLETAREFQPAAPEAQQVMTEVSAGLTEFCVACLCVVEATVALEKREVVVLERVRRFRDRDLPSTPLGRRYLRDFQRHSGELLDIMMTNSQIRGEAIEMLRSVADLLPEKDEKARPVPSRVLKQADRLLEGVYELAGSSLQETIKKIRNDLRLFEGKTITYGLSRSDVG